MEAYTKMRHDKDDHRKFEISAEIDNFGNFAHHKIYLLT